MVALNGAVSLAATLSGGRGRDLIYWPTIAPRGVAVTIDNAREELRLDGEIVMEWNGFQIFRAFPTIDGPFTYLGSDLGETLGGPVFFVEDRWKVDVRMRGGRDWVAMTGGSKRSQIDGGRGADRLRADVWDNPARRAGVTMYGRAGNDRLVGSSKADNLIGGGGRDVADGRDGVDHCGTEARTRCES